MAKKQVAVSLRKPPSPKKLEDLDAFVRGDEDHEPLASSIRELRPETVPPAPRVPSFAPLDGDGAPPFVAGPDGRPLRAFTVYLEPALAEQLSLYCHAADRDVSKVVGEALADLLTPQLEPPSSPAHREPAYHEPPSHSSADGDGWRPSAWNAGDLLGSRRLQRALDATRTVVAFCQAIAERHLAVVR
jgi:hypothetical protein